MLTNILLRNINIIKSYHHKDLNITGISYHSNKVSKNDIFVCITGYKTDGHKYLQHAVEQGAVAAIVEKIDENINIPQYLVTNSRIALSEISATFYGHPSKKLNVIGVTATSGKTTTTYMLNSIFEHHGLLTGLIGSVKVKIGSSYQVTDLTTPDSLELQQFFHTMHEQGVSHVAMEVSSAALELHRVDSVDFDIVTMNNIHREHIDMHGSFENYIQAKTKLIKNAKKDSIAILSLDNKIVSNLISETKATPITFGIDHTEGDFTAKNIDINTEGTKFTMIVNKELNINGQAILPTEFEIELPIPGLHSVSNSMIAIIIALINGIRIKTIQEALNSFKGVERRFDLIYNQGPLIVDDHCSNPGNIDVTFGTIKEMDYNNLQLIYAIRGQRGEIVNRENAEAIAKWALELDVKELIVTKSVSNVTERDVVTDQEAEVVIDAIKSENIKVTLIEDLTEAIQYGMKETKQDDLVLLAGCQGMDDGAPIAIDFVQTHFTDKAKLTY